MRNEKLSVESSNDWKRLFGNVTEGTTKSHLMHCHSDRLGLKSGPIPDQDAVLNKTLVSLRPELVPVPCASGGDSFCTRTSEIMQGAILPLPLLNLPLVAHCGKEPLFTIQNTLKQGARRAWAFFKGKLLWMIKLTWSRGFARFEKVSAKKQRSVHLKRLFSIQCRGGIFSRRTVKGRG